MSNVHYVSVNSKPDYPPRDFFEWANSPLPRAQRKCKTPTPVAENSCSNPPPGAIIFKNQQKNTKQEIEFMKNSTEILICSFLVGGFYGSDSNILSHSPFIYKPTQEIHKNRVPKYDFTKS